MNFNARVQPVAKESDELSLTNLADQPRCVVGGEVSSRPFSRGGCALLGRFSASPPHEHSTHALYVLSGNVAALPIV